MLLSPKEFYAACYGRYAIGAFSVNSIEQIEGVLQGAALACSPVILQVSTKARNTVGDGVLEALIPVLAKKYPQVLYAVHLDHGTEQGAHDCIDSGSYSSVMVDASMHPFEENIAITQRVVEHAHTLGIAVEAELGRLGGKEDDIDVDDTDAFLTDPAQAVEFVRRTGVDSLAVTIGTQHGMKKFKGKHTLHLQRLAEISNCLPRFPLVLHGASSVPHAELVRINAAGGNVDLTSSGVPEEEYRAAYLRGICKINIDTDMRLVWARTYREYFRDHPAGVDLRDPGRLYAQAVAEVIVHHTNLFGSAGKQDEIQKINMTQTQGV